MKKYDEKREFERYDHDASIVYAFHNSDEFYHAKMCNYSRDGMCFEAANAVDPGSDIYIMMENYSPDAIIADLYDGYFAEVRWCCQLSESEPLSYKVGVRYYKTVID